MARIKRKDNMVIPYEALRVRGHTSVQRRAAKARQAQQAEGARVAHAGGARA